MGKKKSGSSSCPSKVKVGSYIFEIITEPNEFWKAQRQQDTLEVSGLTVYKEQKIYVDPDQAKDMFADTLLHELLHVVYYVSGLGEIENATEEQIVFVMTHPLLQILRDNPELTEFLTSHREPK